jgi:hypothetical protein
LSGWCVRSRSDESLVGKSKRGHNTTQLRRISHPAVFDILNLVDRQTARQGKLFHAVSAGFPHRSEGAVIWPGPVSYRLGEGFAFRIVGHWQLRGLKEFDQITMLPETVEKMPACKQFAKRQTDRHAFVNQTPVRPSSAAIKFF